jgi:glutamyl-tRNA synthetase
MLAKKKIYPCFLTTEELDAMREEATANNKTFLIKSPWAKASPEKIQEMLDSGAPYVYRLRVPPRQVRIIEDRVLGQVIFPTSELGGDFVISRSNGLPMYNFAVVVDDASMGITDVLRAQEHLSNTPKQILLYEAMGLKVPRFAHMPLILAPDKSKLSKRHGAVSVGAYKDMGYLPQGMVNYLSMLGWSDGTDQEIYNMPELLEAFKLEGMGKTGAVFDVEKFKWVNGQHLHQSSPDDFRQMVNDELVREGAMEDTSGEIVSKLATLLKDRVYVLNDVGKELQQLITYPLKETLETDMGKKFLDDGSIAETAKVILESYKDGKLEKLGEDNDVLQELAQAVAEARGLKKKKIMRPLRICLTGRTEGALLPDTLAIVRLLDETVKTDYVTLEKRFQELANALDLPM